MQKSSTKYEQTESENTLKGSYTMIKWNLFYQILIRAYGVKQLLNSLFELFLIMESMTRVMVAVPPSTLN